MGFPQPVKHVLHCNPTGASRVPQLRQIFIKNIAPKFHFGRQLSLLVGVSLNHYWSKP
jgi:hypothetical protein